MSELDNAQESVAPSTIVAPVEVPHPTGELPASTPGPVDTTAGVQPEGKEGDEPSQPTRDRRAERRISKLTAKYEEAQREIGRLQGIAEAKAAAATPTGSDARPQQTQFGTFEEYQDALTDWKVDQRLAAREKTTSVQTAQEKAIQAEDSKRAAIADKLRKAGEGVEGFEEAMETITSDDFPLPVVTRDFLRASEHSAAMVVWLADNPEEAARIADLEPAVAVRALEREETRLAAKPPVRTTRTPPPPPTVSGRSTAQVDLSKVTDMDEYARLRGYQR